MVESKLIYTRGRFRYTLFMPCLNNNKSKVNLVAGERGLFLRFGSTAVRRRCWREKRDHEMFEFKQ